MKIIIFILPALLSTAIFSQSASNLPSILPEPPHVLSVTERVKFEIPHFGFSGNPVCDSSGNTFYNLGAPLDKRGMFLGISADGRKHALYEVPQEVGTRGNVIGAVTPSGTFYVLHQDFKNYKLIRFKNDGSVDNITLLSIPAGVNVNRMAIADSEFLYVEGYKSLKDAPNEKPRPGFAAVLNIAGTFFCDLSDEELEYNHVESAKHPIEGDVTVAEDGRFYILHPKQVLILNQSGDKERVIEYQKPVPNSLALRIDVSKGLISIEFDVEHPSNGPFPDITWRMILVNAQTGEQHGDYVLPPEDDGGIVCFNAKTGYSVADMIDDNAGIAIVPIR